MKTLLFTAAVLGLLVSSVAFARGVATSSTFTCSPSSQTVGVKEYATFLALEANTSGQGFGKANVWSAPGGNPDSANGGYTFATEYPALGTYVVTVTNARAGATATCQVIVQ